MSNNDRPDRSWVVEHETERVTKPSPSSNAHKTFSCISPITIFILTYKGRTMITVTNWPSTFLVFLNFSLISWIIPHLVQGAVQIGWDDGKMRRRAVNCRFAAFQANRRFNTAFHERMLIADQILNYKFSIKKNVTLLVLQFALCRAITLPNTLPCPIMYGNLFPGAGKGCTLL